MLFNTQLKFKRFEAFKSLVFVFFFLWHEFCEQNSTVLVAVLVAVARSLAEVKEGRKVVFVHSGGTPACPGGGC